MCVEDLPVGEEILWVTGEDQPGAMQVGSPVDAVTGKAADDASL